ncbi:phage tail fiber protein, partial [Providencia sp. PROV187]|uniref:phage tail fiber protein n=1 Tax=Providencia sp. PROV187 TaxID=2949889 RepID=UPI00234B5C5C
AEQVILIQNGATIYINSIASIQSNTEIILSFPVPASVSNAPYQILTTMVNSVSDAANKIVAMNVSNVQFSDILNRWATESGTITVTLPDGTTQQLRTAKEMDKLLDGKFDKAGGTISGDVTFSKNAIKSTKGTHTLPAESGTLMQVGDFGVGSQSMYSNIDDTGPYITGFRTFDASITNTINKNLIGVNLSWAVYGGGRANKVFACEGGNAAYPNWYSLSYTSNETIPFTQMFYTTANTTKDSNGNLKAASPIVKVFADHIELNEESEGVEMEHLGIGHYLIKGVVGFNSDGAWGINNGFVIPQDHNGKNMVLIDYKVRPDGDIEVFVFHQQNADMPERFQNKRIKYIDKDGNPVYYENYEPCDVPESRWIDMRVEMPVNSIYNLKQAEAERLAKEEAERQAEEEAKNAEIEAEEDI